jgi:hypothetical protein
VAFSKASYCQDLYIRETWIRTMVCMWILLTGIFTVSHLAWSYLVLLLAFWAPRNSCSKHQRLNYLYLRVEVQCWQRLNNGAVGWHNSVPIILNIWCQDNFMYLKLEYQLFWTSLIYSVEGRKFKLHSGSNSYVVDFYFWKSCSNSLVYLLTLF